MNCKSYRRSLKNNDNPKNINLGYIQGTCLVIDLVIEEDRNMMKIEVENILKHKRLILQILHINNIHTIVIL